MLHIMAFVDDNSCHYFQSKIHNNFLKPPNQINGTTPSPIILETRFKMFNASTSFSGKSQTQLSEALQLISNYIGGENLLLQSRISRPKV
jgi:hypothetical protein